MRPTSTVIKWIAALIAMALLAYCAGSSAADQTANAPAAVTAKVSPTANSRQRSDSDANLGAANPEWSRIFPAVSIRVAAGGELASRLQELASGCYQVFSRRWDRAGTTYEGTLHVSLVPGRRARVEALTLKSGQPNGGAILAVCLQERLADRTLTAFSSVAAELAVQFAATKNES